MKFSRGVDAYRDGELVMSFATTNEAAEWLREHGRPRATRARVYDAASGVRKSAYGYTWRLTGRPKREYGSAKDDDRRLYVIWSNMKSRVTDPRNDSYKHEGAKGIRVCDEWGSYDGFRAWAESSGYSEGLILARRDLAGDYCPENCAWERPLLDRGHALANQRKPVIRRDAEGRGNVRGDVTMTMSNIHCNLVRRTSVAYGSVWWYEGDEEAPKVSS